jgi:hypothetical protein
LGSYAPGKEIIASFLNAIKKIRSVEGKKLVLVLELAVTCIQMAVNCDQLTELIYKQIIIIPSLVVKCAEIVVSLSSTK